MINKNKEVLKILEENKITNFQTPEDKIIMEIDKKIEEVDHTIVDDRGPLDLTRQVEETDKRIKELYEQLDIRQKILDRSDREKNDFFKKVQELSELNDKLQKENTDLKYDNKSLAKQVEDKVEEVKALKIKLELLDNKP